MGCSSLRGSRRLGREWLWGSALRYAGMLGHKLVGFVLVLAVWQSGEGLQWVDWPRGLKALGFLSLGSMASWVGCAIGESMGTC